MKNGIAWMSVLAIVLSVSAFSLYNDSILKSKDKVMFQVETNIIPAKTELNTYKYNPSIVLDEFLEKIDSIDLSNHNNIK